MIARPIVDTSWVMPVAATEIMAPIGTMVIVSDSAVVMMYASSILRTLRRRSNDVMMSLTELRKLWAFAVASVSAMTNSSHSSYPYS